MAATKSKPESIDYLTLLGYVTELNIQIFSSNYIECNFTDSELLGSGNSMNVYHGYLKKDPNNHADEHIPVAIKVPKANVKDMNRDSKAFKVLADVRQELRMMKHFDAHPNIINLYGVFFQDLKPLTIVEIAEDCITDYLATKKENGTPLDWEAKARFCCEVADGLQALHVAKIVHGDLKGDNILLFKDSEDKNKLVAKITDFGYSATTASIEQGGGTGGSLHFLAPECTKYAPTSMKEYENKPLKDKYAFGLFVWQVAKDGEIPYEEMDEEEIQDLKNTDKNLDELMNLLEEDTPQHFKDVILSMTKYSPEERGDLTNVRQMMELDTVNDASFAAAKKNLELYARELPRDVVKADLSSIELMTIPASLKTKIYRSYEKASATDDSNAMFMMAICHSKGFAVEIDNQKGLEWCIKAASAGSLSAIINLAENYDIKDIPVKPEVAFPWYLKAAEEGYRNAINRVINCYRGGIGVQRSMKKRQYWRNILNTIPPASEMNMNIGETSLHRAARLGNVEAARLFLEQKNDDINTKNKEGLTALHIAAQHGHIEVVKLLIGTFKADTKAQTDLRRTPLQLAILRGHVDVARLLNNETDITNIYFGGIKLSHEEVRLMAESLKLFPTLTQLTIYNNKIGKEGASALIEYLKQNSTLKELDLTATEIDEDGVCGLAECLEHNSTLIKLDLTANNIGDDGACALAEYLQQNSTLTVLRIINNGIGKEGGCALAEYLEKNSSLDRLYLSQNGISDEGACALAESLKKNSTLTYLDLGENGIRKEGACALGECLKQNLTLTELNLENNGVRDEGMCGLSEGLKQNSALRILRLDYNRIGNEGSCGLAECLKQNSFLTKIYTGYNEIGNEGAFALAECLKLNSVLTLLSLEFNKIDDEGAYAFVESLKQNSTLTYLCLGCNKLSDKTEAILKENKVFEFGC